MRGQIPPRKFFTFLLAGNSTITVESLTTGRHLTYKVTQAKGKPFLYWVKVLSGPENTRDYTFIGTIIKDTFHPARGSNPHTKSVAGFRWLFTAPIDKIEASVRLWNEGRCCRCGRKLTTPESVQLGIGPECSQRK